MAGYSKTETIDRTSGGDTIYVGFGDVDTNIDALITYVNDLKKSYASSSAPTSPAPDEGQLWFDSANDILKAYNGSAWTAVSGISDDTSWQNGLIKGLEVSYKDADEVYVSGGMIHVNNGTTDYVLACTAQLTKQLTSLGTSEMRYLYIDPPASGSVIAAADVEHNTTAPTYSHAKYGWYHPTTTDLRFIGSVPIDGGGNIIKGYRSENGHRYTYDNDAAVVASFSTATFTDIATLGNFVPNIANAIATLLAQLTSDAGGTRQLLFRYNGASPTTGLQEMAAVASGVQKQCVDLVLDASGLAEWRVNNTSAVAKAWIRGYWEPR